MKPLLVTALRGASASRGAEGGGPGVEGGEAERDDWVPMMIVAAADGAVDLQQKARANCGAALSQRGAQHEFVIEIFNTSKQ